MMDWRLGGHGRIPQNDVNLATMSQSHLMALGQQGSVSHEQLLEMQGAQQSMREAAMKQNIDVNRTLDKQGGY